MDKIAKDIDKLDSIDVDLSIFDSYAKESSEVKKIFKKLMTPLIRKPIERLIKRWKHSFIT